MKVVKTSLKLSLNQFEKKDKTHRIIVRLVFKRRLAELLTDYFVQKKDWNNKLERIEKSCKLFNNVDRVNAKLFSIKNDFYDRIQDISKLNLQIQNATHLKILILNRPKQITYSSYSKLLEDEMKNMNRRGNASVYAYARSFFFRHNGYRDFSLSEINYSFLKSVEAFHLAAGNGYNSLSVNMRTLRAVFNRAIKEGYVKQDQYPFIKYKIKSTKTKKRAVCKQVIEQIENYNARPGSMRAFAKDMFLFSFYTQGTNISDIAYIKVSAIINNRLEYKRAKTGQFFSIALTEKAIAIVNYYKEAKKPDEFLFPIIIRKKDPELVAKDIYNANRNVNKNLQKIARELGIEEHLTTYVARHSWATIAKLKGLDVALISQGLGHENIKTTQIYLDSFDSAVLDKANKLITE